MVFAYTLSIEVLIDLRAECERTRRRIQAVLEGPDE